MKTAAGIAARVFGIDIGGTKIGVCVGDSRGRVLASTRLAVDHRLPAARAMDRACDALEKIAGKSALHAGSIGCACPGPFDYQKQRFLNPPNNPGWHGFELGKYLAARYPKATRRIMNDANAAALAEWKWGAARGADTAVFLTMSTGMGAGLIVGGRLFEGPLGLAGEIGQIRLTPGDAGPVGFGKRGSVEGYCSGPGMQQMAHAEALVCRQKQEHTGLLRELDEHGEVSTHALCELAISGDRAAKRVTDRAALELGRLCAILVDVLNPNVIVLGTIGSAYPKLFVPGAMKVVKAEAIKPSAGLVKIKASGFSPEIRGDVQALAALG